ncbi:hypothetical protein Q1695_011331 [Nippostrongylus brasiliensis]|nr:hypothetical protein Q1695_011331 [Nippostrongylus brasiliensis]
MPPEFIDEKLPAEILSKLASFREFDKFCDVTVEADSSSKAKSEPTPSTSIRAHKFVLAAASPYFRETLSNGSYMKPTTTNQIRIAVDNIDGKTMSVLVDYMYTGRLDINERNVRALFGAANILQLDCIRNECSRHLKEHLSISNWVETAALAKAHDCTELDDAVVSFARQHFGCIAHRLDFLNCLILAAPLLQPRSSFGMATVGDSIYAVGGRDTSGTLRSVEIYDAQRNSWRAGPEMQHCRCGPGVTALNGTIFAVGGINGSKVCCEAEMLDPRQGKWISLPSMMSSRSHLGLAAVNGLLYAAGGRYDKKTLNTVEVYDPRACRWTTAQPMLKKRREAGVTVFRDQIVVVGGSMK